MDTLYDFTKVAFFRVKTSAEIQKTADLAAEIWGEYYPEILGDEQVEYMIRTYQSADAIARGMEKGCMYFVLQYCGEDAGYFAVHPNEPEGKIFLSKLYIREAARGKGIAKAAWEKLCVIAREHGIHRVWLTVNKHNTPSIEVYKKLGFEICDSIVSPIGDGFVMDDYVMERDI